MKIFVPLLLIPLVSLVHARDIESAAGADICDARPDLCGSASPSPKKKKRTPRRHPATNKVAQETKGDLLEEEFERENRPSRRSTSYERTPLPGDVTYESYLLSNTMHPAIARRPASMLMNQKAFVQPVVRSTITGSTLDQPVQNNAPAAPNSTLNLPANAGHGVGNASPSPDGINPGAVPSAADSTNGSPLH